MIEAMHRLKNQPHPNQIFYAATIQEEGQASEMRGAQTLRRASSIPISHCPRSRASPNDTPGNKPDASLETIGGGPGVMLYSFSEYPNRQARKFVQSVATEKQIPCN